MFDFTKNDYIAWIPTVSGSLLFELVNDEFHVDSNSFRALADFKTIYSSGYQDNLRRKEQIVSTGLFDLNDQSPNFHKAETVYTRFVCVLSKESKEDFLSGSVWILPIINDKKKPFAGLSSEFHIDIIEEIESYSIETLDLREKSFADGKTRKINTLCSLDPILKSLNKKFTNSLSMKFDVQISSKGITKITPCYEDCDGEPSSLSRLEGLVSELTLVEEVFIYLKHLLHKHKHHSEKDDNYLTAIKYDDPECWLRLYKNLLRSINFQRRATDKEKNHELISNVLGACSYASSFLTIIDSELIQTKKHHKIAKDEFVFLNNIESSMQSLLIKNSSFVLDSYKETVKRTIYYYKYIFSAIFTILLYLAKSKYEQLPIESEEYNNGFFEYAVAYFEPYTAFILVAVFLFVEVILVVVESRGKFLSSIFFLESLKLISLPFVWLLRFLNNRSGTTFVRRISYLSFSSKKKKILPWSCGFFVKKTFLTKEFFMRWTRYKNNQLSSNIPIVGLVFSNLLILSGFIYLIYNLYLNF